MSSNPPPTDALVQLASVLGDDNVRTLVQTFLSDFPVSFQALSTSPDRKIRHRVAHSMKSNTRLVGALELSHYMATLEDRLSRENGGDVTPKELSAISAEFDTIAAPLRIFAGTP